MTSGENNSPAVTLAMVIVNKGNHKITELRTILQSYQVAMTSLKTNSTSSDIGHGYSK
jgi:hypothetical protein